MSTHRGPKVRADVLADKVRESGWQRLSYGAGAKGERLYAWALIATESPTHHLLIRHSLNDRAGLWPSTCFAPGQARYNALSRWTELAGRSRHASKTGENEAAYDHCLVRLYPAWCHYITRPRSPRSRH